MARKRLSPAFSAELDPDDVRPAPPIARVAGEAATRAALSEVTGELTRAEAEGRLIRALPLEAIDTGHLVRDRLALPDDEGALRASLRARGQQVPVEVESLGGGRFGLISGWRRLSALKDLHAETGDSRFGSVLALVRAPADRASAYLAMVEENEIRAGLSYYERARIAWMAAERGVYPGVAEALRGLFGNASRARRSKIGSFITIARALDAVLRFPTHIPERLGLKLAKWLDSDPNAGDKLCSALRSADPRTPGEELAALTAALPPASSPSPAPSPARPAAASPAKTFAVRRRRGRIEITGPGVTPAFADRLEVWLKDQEDR